jgi:hypothetical protein
LSTFWSPLPEAAVELPPDDVPELMVDPELPPEPLEPDADGLVELVLPDPDTAGELEPLLPELLVPPLIEEPVELDPELPDVVGDADGDWLLSEMPAACIACWLQRSKSARLVAPAMARPGTRSAATAADANADFSMVIVILLAMCGQPWKLQGACHRAGHGDAQNCSRRLDDQRSLTANTELRTSTSSSRGDAAGTSA